MRAIRFIELGVIKLDDDDDDDQLPTKENYFSKSYEIEFTF